VGDLLSPVRIPDPCPRLAGGGALSALSAGALHPTCPPVMRGVEAHAAEDVRSAPGGRASMSSS
jgi:hypothetical protein